MKKIISLVIAISCISLTQAQYVGDALRYSQNFPTLSARSMSMGGAFSSLGGDYSSAAINPAGLGLYRKSEFVFSPGIGFSNTTADYLGQSHKDAKYQLTMSNIGYVGTWNSGKDKGLVSASYALGYSRMNNFNNQIYMGGDNNESSLIDAFMSNIDGVDPEDLDAFTSRLAFDAYLIDTADNEYFTPVLLPVDQRRTVETRGGTGQWNLAFGLNFDNIWYIGASAAVYRLNYENIMTHSEFDIANSDYDHFYFTEDLDVEGTGFSLSLGTMVRLFKIMRVGASLQLPTYYKIDEFYRNTMYAEYDNGFIPSDDNGTIYAEGEFDYKLATPLKLQGGASVQLGTMGIIAADVEYIDYSGMRLRSGDYHTDFSSENSDIEDAYRPVLNLKMGGEARFDNLFARLGFGYYPSPFEEWELNKDASRTELTAGFGYRSNSFFFDLGFSALLNKEKYYLYSATIDHIADLKQQNYRFVASVGFRF